MIRILTGSLSQKKLEIKIISIFFTLFISAGNISYKTPGEIEPTHKATRNAEKGHFIPF